MYKVELDQRCWVEDIRLVRNDEVMVTESTSSSILLRITCMAAERYAPWKPWTSRSCCPHLARKVIIFLTPTCSRAASERGYGIKLDMRNNWLCSICARGKFLPLARPVSPLLIELHQLPGYYVISCGTIGNPSLVIIPSGSDAEASEGLDPRVVDQLAFRRDDPALGDVNHKHHRDLSD